MRSPLSAWRALRACCHQLSAWRIFNGVAIDHINRGAATLSLSYALYRGAQQHQQRCSAHNRTRIDGAHLLWRAHGNGNGISAGVARHLCISCLVARNRASRPSISGISAYRA